MRFVSFFIIIFTLHSVALAEYRAFRLVISPQPAADAKPDQAPVGKMVISTLDPDQYRGYFHVSPGDKITYTETWMCPGRTSDFKETCPAPVRTPASIESPPAPSTSSASPSSP